MQGVGFRFTTLRLAAQREVTGFVRNEPDGAVTVVAEGREPVLLKFLRDIRTSSLGPGITGEHIGWESASGRFQGFDIAY